MKKILITLLVCTGIFSCSKDNPDPAKDSYKPGNVIIADAPVMYTNDGVIHDQALMKDYLTRRGIPLTSYVFDGSAPPALTSYTLEFQAGKNVLIGNIKAEIISQNDSLILMAGVESSVIEIGQKSWSDSLMDKVNLNGPLAECPTYYTAPCPYRKKYPLQIINAEYYIPYVVATISTNANIPTSFGVPMDYTNMTHKAGETLLFNKSMTTTLGGTVTYKSNNIDYTLDRYDTVLVQTMRQRLVKQ